MESKLHPKELETLPFFKWKIHGVWFKVSDRNNEPLNFQEMLTNSSKHSLKLLPVKKKCIPVRITSESAYVKVKNT